MEKPKTPSQVYREQEEKKIAIQQLDWWTLAEIRQLEKEYERKIHDERA